MRMYKKYCILCSEKAAGSSWDVSGGSSGAASYERSVSESERSERLERSERSERSAPALGDKLRALSLDLDKQPFTALTGTRIITLL